jgi:nitrogen regulatory protein PII-like uncharacterized protein
MFPGKRIYGVPGEFIKQYRGLHPVSWRGSCKKPGNTNHSDRTVVVRFTTDTACKKIKYMMSGEEEYLVLFNTMNSC